MENSIEEDIERLKLCSTNQCHICGRYEKEECMLERNRCEQHILSDYKRVLKENEELKIKNNAIKRESEAYAENMIRLDNELNLEKEKSKYEWIRQNCLPQELVNKLYIPIQKVKDKIRHYQELQDNYIKKYDETNEGLQAMINVLQELLEGRK